LLPREIGEPDEEDLNGDDKQEAESNRETARLWISGLEIVRRKLGIARVVDLSATPFFLRGSCYREGTLFHWTMSDFSLMDAIDLHFAKVTTLRPARKGSWGTVALKGAKEPRKNRELPQKRPHR
jgi:hypothetical protein